MRKTTVLQEADLLCGFGIWSRHMAETGQSQQWQRIQYANKSQIYYKRSPPFRKLDNKQGGPHLAQKSQNYIHPRKTVDINHLGKIWVNNSESQEATVRTGCRTTDWFQIGKGIRQGSILSPYLYHLEVEYIMWNTRMDEAQTGIKIARRNINNLRYPDDSTLWQKAKKPKKPLDESERG